MLTRIVISDTTLDYHQLDSTAIVRRSMAGTIPIEHAYGVTTGKDGKDGSAEVLLKGTPQELSRFLSSFAGSAVYSDSTRFHRI